MDYSIYNTRTAGQPAVTGKRPLALPETTGVIDRSVRPCLSWTAVADEAHVPLQTLVQHRLISPQERKAFLCELIPQTPTEQLADGGKAWATSTIFMLIQRVRQLAGACGLELRPAILQKRDYCLADFQRVSEQLVKVYQECVVTAFSNSDSTALQLLLQSTAPLSSHAFLRQLNAFFSERPSFLSDPDFRNTIRQLIETHWNWALKAIRPLSMLWRELDAGQTLLKQIAPETLKSRVVICLDQRPVLLEAADCAVLAETSEAIKKVLEEGDTLPIPSTDFQAFCSCYLRDEDPSFDQLGSMFLVADRFSLVDILHRCVEWVHTCDTRAKPVENICLLENKLKDKLRPDTYEAWSIVRDGVISKMLSDNPHDWSSLLQPFAHAQHLPLIVEHLTLSSRIARFTQNLGDEIKKMSRLKTLKIDMAPAITDKGSGLERGWRFLNYLPQLRSLNVIINRGCETGFHETVTALSKLEDLTIIQQNYWISLPDIRRMHALQSLKIENTWIRSDCSPFLLHPSLKKLFFDNARFTHKG
ncbi:MAG: hypothetical protein LLG04_06865, partial [Parachlamydia sp.]|nr:hypothetical protein [Parachlamydia sp.]